MFSQRQGDCLGKLQDLNICKYEKRLEILKHRLHLHQIFEKNIVVLTQHNGYRKKKSSAIPLIRLQSGKKYPYLVQAMEQRHIMYNQTLDDLKEMESRGEVYIIQPKEPITIHRTERDPEKLKALYDTGRKEAMEHLENIRNFLAL